MKNRSQYVRWPGDADPNDASGAEQRRSLAEAIRRGPQTLRSLIKDGYVSEVDGDVGFGVVLRGPGGYHRYYHPNGGYFYVREYGSDAVAFEDVRSAAAYFRALIDWDERQDKDSLARIVKTGQKAISLSWRP